jgi:formylglycine-generating enzyme required for sulfatase activity
VENAGASDPERPRVEGMVVEDLKLLAPDDLAAPIRQEVARRILEHRAWAAWNAGNDLRPPAGDEGPRVPGPAVRPWLDLAFQAWPGVEDTLSYQRLAARLEDLSADPRAVVALLLAEKEWGPAKVLPISRLDSLPRKDRLLLARALKRWGDLRQGEETRKEAESLWRLSWEVYQRCVAPNAEGESGEYPASLVQAARFEAALVAALVKDRDTVLRAWDDYLELNPEDPLARTRRDALARVQPLEVPEQMRILGYETVVIPAGVFRTGAESPGAAVDERPFQDGTTIPVQQAPAREVLFEEYRIGVVEVTVGQYLEYLKAMEDPERARRLRHPQEPEEHSKRPDARRPRNLAQWSKDEPVRGVSWWDAWACAQFLGGRLPTEAEWEKAAFWAGRRTPWPWMRILLDYREALGPSWAGFWPDNAIAVGRFDQVPSGCQGLLGRVAEWTLDPFSPRTAGTRDGVAENVAEIPPRMPAGNAELMCVRGGSFYHRPPGEAPRESPVDKDEPAPGGKEGAGPPPQPTIWRGLDPAERRGVPAGRAPKWVGFRVVVSTRAAEKPR